MERRVLGKGLGALIPEKRRDTEQVAPLKKDLDRVVWIETDRIKPGKYQTRERFNQQKLEELTSSIKEKGLIQPVLVRSVADEYELIAGERRWRAAKSLNIGEIPAIIKDVDDISSLELSLIENVQRENLNPIEEAFAYQKLIDEFGFTQVKISQIVGKDRTSVANSLRLLKLPQDVQDKLAVDEISMGHAKVILTISEPQKQIEFCNIIISNGLSVRELENLVKSGPMRKKKLRVFKDKRDPEIVALEEELQHIIGTKVSITVSKRRGQKRGKVQIEYYSEQDLGRIVEFLKSRKP